jgi:hypothetical protein
MLLSERLSWPEDSLLAKMPYPAGSRPLIAQDLNAGLVPSKPGLFKRGQMTPQAIEKIKLTANRGTCKKSFVAELAGAIVAKTSGRRWLRLPNRQSIGTTYFWPVQSAENRVRVTRCTLTICRTE